MRLCFGVGRRPNLHITSDSSNDSGCSVHLRNSCVSTMILILSGSHKQTLKPSPNLAKALYDISLKIKVTEPSNVVLQSFLPMQGSKQPQNFRYSNKTTVHNGMNVQCVLPSCRIRQKNLPRVVTEAVCQIAKWRSNRLHKRIGANQRSGILDGRAVLYMNSIHMMRHKIYRTLGLECAYVGKRKTIVRPA